MSTHWTDDSAQYVRLDQDSDDFFGVSVATWVPAQSSLIMTAAPSNGRGSVNGMLAAFRGLVAFPAPIVGEPLFNAFGHYVPVSLSLAGEAFTTMAILKFLPRNT